MARTIALVVMAAGQSRRFGNNKLVATFEGHPLVYHVAARVAALAQTERDLSLVLVTREARVAALGRDLGYDVRFNGAPERGLSETIRLALVDRDEAYTIFFVADQPRLSHRSLTHFLHVVRMTEAPVVSARGRGRPQNPVAFAKRCYGELRALRGDVGGRVVQKAHEDETVWVDWPDDELSDVDTPDDLLRLSGVDTKR